MPNPLIYYLDESLETRCPVNEKGDALVDWGSTIPGSKKERILFVKNKTNDRLVIRQPYTNDEDLKIIDYPSRLFGNGSGKVVLQFSPNPERLDPLKAGWGFEDVVIG